MFCRTAPKLLHPRCLTDFWICVCQNSKEAPSHIFDRIPSSHLIELINPNNAKDYLQYIKFMLKNKYSCYYPNYKNIKMATVIQHIKSKLLRNKALELFLRTWSMEMKNLERPNGLHRFYLNNCKLSTNMDRLFKRKQNSTEMTQNKSVSLFHELLQELAKLLFWMRHSFFGLRAL